MSKVSLIAKLVIKDGTAAEYEAAAASLMAAAEEEAGLEIYSLHRDNGSENTYWFFELYTDQAALDVHGKGEGMKAAMGSLGPFLAAAPEIMHLAPVVAKGLDL